MSQNEKDDKNTQQVDGVQLFLPDELKASAFCNSAFAQFSPEEFSIDFVNMGAMSNSVVSRIVMTPSHTKRLMKLLAQKVHEYEDMFGEIPEAIEPKK
ncbi:MULTISPECIES: DUF3467 domain-containing protein [Pseudomonadales]|uniref:DUF3467 domain-containing protein n=1 Tax=Pseudomonadales TaxID=72274 RepID=UPI001FF19D13|nr:MULTISPECIES: DUF3467 domain-containing protein [Pseudomonadales]MCK0107644.1 DUF3467 domain-containing protein [Marinobacter sp. S0848L]